MEVSDFFGTYYVKQGTSTDDRIQVDDKVVIVASQDPQKDAHLEVTRNEQPVFGDDYAFDADGGCLTCDRWEGGLLYQLQVSLYMGSTATYSAIYGVTIKKDPDSVGAWGADSNP